MKEFRVKEITTSLGKKYYIPQGKCCFIWWNLSNNKLNSLPEAKVFLNNYYTDYLNSKISKIDYIPYLPI